MAESSSLLDPGLKQETGVGETSEAAVVANDNLLLYSFKKAKRERGCTAKERISKMPPSTAGKRSSIYRGVTRHRWTGRYEAHLWDKSTWNQNQNKKGKQVYLGAYDDEEAAARAYDLAALKYWGPGTLINFRVTDYTRDLEEMQNASREDYLASLRRKSSGFSRGLSKYCGLSRYFCDCTSKVHAVMQKLETCVVKWDASFDHLAGSEYFNSIHYSEDATENEYIGSFCIDRKIDLTASIKWWGSNRAGQLESTSKAAAGDIGSDLKISEHRVQSTEPYQMPRLGMSAEQKRLKGSRVSALSILSRSAAYKSLQEHAANKRNKTNENDDQNIVNRTEYGKPIVKSTRHDEVLSVQKNVYPLTSFLTAPLLANYNSPDPLVDPNILWASLVPVLPAGPSINPEVPKTETSPTYTYFQSDE